MPATVSAPQPAPVADTPPDLTPAIRTPWIDPLLIYDAFLRFSLAPNTDAFVLATGHSLATGQPMSAWTTLFRADPPVVSFALYRDSDGLLNWVPLYLNDLPRWLKQADAVGLDLLRPFCRLNRDAFRLRTTPSLLNALRHPNSPDIEHLVLLSSVGNENVLRVGITNGGIRALGSFQLPFRTRTMPEARYTWRRIRGHGAKPATSFFSKRYNAPFTPTQALFCGIELEMELSAEARNDAREALFLTADTLPPNGAAERLHIELDGSVRGGGGIEAVLMPHEVGSLQSEVFWRRMWETACEFGSNREGSAGMHIHASAAPALAPLCRQDRGVGVGTQQGIIGFCIDMVTGLLAGGPRLSTIDDFKPVVTGFGRPYEWEHSDFARVDFTFIHKRTGMHRFERYRHINWHNEKTIEFRIFGPMGYTPGFCSDWLNVSTQLVAAIIGFSREIARRVLWLDQPVDQSTTTIDGYLATLPAWMRNRIRRSTPINNRFLEYFTLDSQGVTYCVSRTMHSDRWLPGIPTAEVPALERSIGNNSVPALVHRKAIWRELIQFMRDESPIYDIALCYLEQHVTRHVQSTATETTIEPAEIPY